MVSTTLLITLALVNVSVYHPVMEETDANPMQPADPTITYVDVDPAIEHHCAVSQDLLWFRGGLVHFGDFIVLDLPGMATYYRISDTMHVSVTQHIDLLVPEGVMGYWRNVPVKIIAGGKIDLHREGRQDMETWRGRGPEACSTVPGDCFPRRSCSMARCTRRCFGSGGRYDPTRHTNHAGR